MSHNDGHTPRPTRAARKRPAQHNESINPSTNTAAGFDLGDTIKGESHGCR